MLRISGIYYGRFVPHISRAWLSHHLYGWRFAPNIAKFPYPYVYLKTILYIASADHLHTNERRYIQGLVEVLLAESDPDMMQFIDVYGKGSRSSITTASSTSSPQLPQTQSSGQPYKCAMPRTSEPYATPYTLDSTPMSDSGCADVLPQTFISGSMLTSPVLSRVLLYDAVKAASADKDYTECERVHVYSTGKQLGIPESVTRVIESIADREMTVAGRKRALLLYGQVPSSHGSLTKHNNTLEDKDNN